MQTLEFNLWSTIAEETYKRIHHITKIKYTPFSLLIDHVRNSVVKHLPNYKETIKQALREIK
jgi:hypothetical protein